MNIVKQTNELLTAETFARYMKSSGHNSFSDEGLSVLFDFLVSQNTNETLYFDAGKLSQSYSEQPSIPEDYPEYLVCLPCNDSVVIEVY